LKLLPPALLAAASFAVHATPLQWDACAWGQSAAGSTCTGTPAALTWQQALQAASQANAALYQGQADWRVPNRTELESTVDLAAPGAGAFWSSTSYHPAPTRAWTVDFSDGATSPADKTATRALRLVRGGAGAAAYTLPGPSTTPPLPLPGAPGQTAQATVSGGGGSCTFTSAGFIDAATLPAPPGYVQLAADPFAFVLDGCAPGGTVQITITYPQPLPAGARFWKHGPRSGQPTGWYAFPATVGGNTVTFSITNGGLGDDDLDADNSQVVDAGAPVLLAAGGVAGIPTLSQWGVLLLSVLSGLLGLAALRRRA